MLFRSLVVWFVIIIVETAHGILRRLLLVPIVGQLHSNQIGVFVGSGLILLTVWLFYGWLKADSFLSKLLVGSLWCLLTFCFELALSHISGAGAGQVLADYNLAQGGLMLFGMVIMQFSLVIASKAGAR